MFDFIYPSAPPRDCPAYDALGLLRLHEFAPEREGQDVVEELGFPRHEVMQALELHADKFATRYCVSELLWGQDPAGDLAGPNISLVERLVIFTGALFGSSSLQGAHADYATGNGDNEWSPRRMSKRSGRGAPSRLEGV